MVDVKTPTELRAIRSHGKWVLSVVVAAGGMIAGWAAKSAVLDHRVTQVEKLAERLPVKVEQHESAIIKLNESQANMVKGIDRIEAAVIDMNDKLSRLRITNRR